MGIFKKKKIQNLVLISKMQTAMGINCAQKVLAENVFPNKVPCFFPYFLKEIVKKCNLPYF
jgi:hypothetical protein